MSTKSDQIKGQGKSTAGVVTGDDELEAEGDAETRGADAAAHIDRAKDKAARMSDQVKDTIEEIAAKAKHAIDHQ